MVHCIFSAFFDLKDSDYPYVSNEFIEYATKIICFKKLGQHNSGSKNLSNQNSNIAYNFQNKI